jgi:hypothetical protein
MNSNMNTFADYTASWVIAPVTGTWDGKEAGWTLVKPQKVRKTKKQRKPRLEPVAEP